MGETPIPQNAFFNLLREKKINLSRSAVSTLQINLGKLCNQACRHCHVEAGPTKLKENMSRETFVQLARVIENSPKLRTIDITGGAPELNPHFFDLVRLARRKNIEVIDRCNLTVLFEEGQQDTARFLAENGVQVIASMPCYSKDNVDRQRGNGVFDRSIKGLKLLNTLGYGLENSHLKLHLVYNPLGPTLPPDQKKLEAKYKQQLEDDFGIFFHQLFTITNMPIKRFLEDLDRSGQLDEYMHLLLNCFNVAALDNVMCRALISIGWDGKVYDCDFNQMLEMQVSNGVAKSIFEIESLDELQNSAIHVANHCLGCTAGSGSSCTGALTESPKQSEGGMKNGNT